MKLIKNITENFLPYVFIFLASLYRPYDPDLGWHLRYGEYFFKTHQILRDNIFSTMMPNFHWANTDWLVDILTYFFYHYLGFLGITLLAATVITLTFLFFSKAFKLDFFEKAFIFPFILYIETNVNSVSFRGQLVSICFLGALFYIIERYSDKKSKIIYLSIPLFLLWANLNGQFVLGLALFAIWIFLYLIMSFFKNGKVFNVIKSELITLGSVLALTVIATLINPFGFGIYEQTLNHFGSKYLKDIAEYLPFARSTASWWNQLIIGVLIGVGFVFVFFNGEIKKRFPMFTILGILYALSWTVRRYAWSFYYLAIPFLKPLVYFVRPNSKKNTFLSATVLFTIYIILTIVIKTPLSQFRDMSWEIYCKQYSNCSEKAAEFVIKNKLSNNKLMTVYDWGGWLIWNYPKLKPSIDGRMHMWQDANGYSAFADYYEYEQDRADISYSQFDTVLMSKSKDLYSQLLRHVKKGDWKIIYQDNVSGVFVKNKDL